MKNSALMLALLLLLVGCAARQGGAPEEPEIDGLGVGQVMSPRDVPVGSYVLVDATEVNAEAAAAATSGEEWPRDPLEVAKRLTGPLTGRYVSIEKVDEPGERAGATTVTVIDGSFLDDSVWGVWNRLLLTRMDDGTWRITEARLAWRCYRGHQRDSFGERWCL